MDNALVQRVKSIKQKITDEQAEYNKLRGKKDQLVEQLKKEHDVDNVDDANKLLEEILAELEQQRQELVSIVDKMENIMKSVSQE